MTVDLAQVMTEHPETAEPVRTPLPGRPGPRVRTRSRQPPRGRVHGRAAQRSRRSGVCLIHVDALDLEDRHTHEVLDPDPGPCQGGRKVVHHLPGLGGDVVAADQRSGRIDGVLPADVNGRRSRRNDGDLDERGAREEPLWANQFDFVMTATLFINPDSHVARRSPPHRWCRRGRPAGPPLVRKIWSNNPQSDLTERSAVAPTASGSSPTAARSSAWSAPSWPSNMTSGPKPPLPRARGLGQVQARRNCSRPDRPRGGSPDAP